MKVIWQRLLYEPALVMQIPTVVLAFAAGIWTNEWLAFAAGAWAAVGAIVTRANVTPVHSTE